MAIATKQARIDIKLWAPLDEIEPKALDQIERTAELPWTVGLAVMPDVHAGIGATVGTVVAMEGAVAPAAVGVDIGCGMTAVRTNLTATDLPDDLHGLYHDLCRSIPVGFHEHRDPVAGVAADPLWDRFSDLEKKAHHLRAKAMRQVGTLGGGNHFIELDLDAEDRVWLMLHSGSRNLGNELAKLHIAKARTLDHNRELPDRDLAVFLEGTPEFDAYWHDVEWAQRYAALNRTAMMDLYVSTLRRHIPKAQAVELISCHHNYVAAETHQGRRVLVTRKGAIRASSGELGIIPGAMGARSFIVRGLGNPEAFESASHGAGRKMSRTAASKQYSAADVAQSTQGIVCRKDAGVRDEIRDAYKDIDVVMARQSDLVEPVAVLHSLMVIKG